MKKILFIRFSSIGDIVLTSPVIRCVKKQLKQVEIHYLTKNSFKDILQHNPYIDHVHGIDKHLSEVMDKLKNEDFDLIIDLHNNLRSKSVKIQLRKPYKAFHKLNFKKWILVNLKINHLPNNHIVDRYLDTVKHIGVRDDEEGLDYFIPEDKEIELHKVLPIAHHNGYIAFVVGAKHNTKQLPLEKIISICKKINFPLVLLGGKEDEKKGESIEKAIGQNVFNGCGLFSLEQSASLIRQAEKVISHDTGLMHIAAAFKKTIISVWGNTIPEFGMSPYLPHPDSKIIEVKGLSCRPCSKIGFSKCPKGHFDCMNKIDEDEIVRLA